MQRLLGAISLAALISASCAPASAPAPAAAPPAAATAAAAPTPAPTPAPSPSPAAPRIPAPVAATVDPAKSAFLLLDLTSATCTPQRSCVASLPGIAALLKKARDANVFVVYSDTAGNPPIRDEVAQRSSEHKVTTRADKFYATDLDQVLKGRGVETLVIVGTFAHGAVLYTTFSASLRGYTVVVAEDGISHDDPFATYATRWQLLNQPGFGNPDNKPLEKGRVTLSRTDLIGFGAAPSAAAPPAPAAAPAIPINPALSAVETEAKTTAVLSLDLINPTCQTRPQCLESLPKVAALLKRARDAKAAVFHSITTAQGVTTRPEVAAQPGEATVAANADKFFGTTLDQQLKEKGAKTLVIVGTAANGAVLYTAYQANLRGYTVVVAEDGISVSPGLELGLSFTRWQLLNQPGFANPENRPLEAQRVTLGLSDFIKFK